MDAIADAMHANMLRADRRIGCLTAASAVADTSAWLLIDAGVGMARFNHALVAGPAADTQRAVADAVEWFKRRKAEPTFLLRDPMDAPLAAEVAKHGFVPAESEPVMLLENLDTTYSPPGDLSIRPVYQPADIARYAEVDAPAWHIVTRGIARTVRDFPDFTMLLGEVDGEAVATSMAVVTDGLVGVYNVQVRAAYRNRGFGRAMTAAAIDVGRRAGCTAATLQSTPMGLPLYERMGFSARYGITVYARTGALE